jgi:hypothetical protein
MFEIVVGMEEFRIADCGLRIRRGTSQFVTNPESEIGNPKLIQPIGTPSAMVGLGWTQPRCWRPATTQL